MKTETVIEKCQRLGLMDYAIGEMVDEIERLRMIACRYEQIRRLSPRDFALLYARNLNGAGTFDELVYELGTWQKSGGRNPPKSAGNGPRANRGESP